MTTSDKLREIAHKYGGAIITGYGQSSASGFTEMFTAEEQCLSDLTALISEHYYPKEFLLWTGENCQYYPDTNEWMYFESPMTQQYFKGTDELFNYWKENEQ
jgi:hypothetical protein